MLNHSQMMAELQAAGYIVKQPMPILNMPSEAVYVINTISTKSQEHIMVLALNTKHELLDHTIIGIGTISGTTCSTRDVFKWLFERNAACFMLSHNHPSGSTDPSQDDLAITRKFVEAGRLMDCQLLDHIIVGGKNDFMSLRDGHRGLWRE